MVGVTEYFLTLSVFTFSQDESNVRTRVPKEKLELIKTVLFGSFDEDESREVSSDVDLSWEIWEKFLREKLKEAKDKIERKKIERCSETLKILVEERTSSRRPKTSETTERRKSSGTECICERSICAVCIFFSHLAL
jgi:hypothetical protein